MQYQNYEFSSITPVHMLKIRQSVILGVTISRMMNLETVLTLKIYQLVAAGLITAVVSGSIGYQFAQEEHITQTEIRLHDKGSEFSFSNPILDFQSPPNSLMNGEVRELKEHIENIIEQATDDRRITGASVFFRDLQNGPWFTVNDELRFSPASLLKIPVMIAYFKMAETDPGILQKTLTHTTAFDWLPTHNTPDEQSEIKVGETYTIESLIEHMIINSDNSATVLLRNNLDPVLEERIYHDLDITPPDLIDTKRPFIGTRNYASFFRILYNSTYLSREYSEKALSILARTNFTTGIRAGVPAATTVSNKFGIARTPGADSQLHDCGIIYGDARKNYAICVMTTGEDITEMASVIRDISAEVYQAVHRE
jgi:beta-lactamase class A